MSFRLKEHLATINAHKIGVMKNCFRIGLYRQGLLHDLSKYTPIELLNGARYYQGDRSPNVGERLEKGYSDAWLHHKGRNKHHWEYWVDFSMTEKKYTGMKMPERYVLEMVCDRIAASKVYKGDQYTDDAALEYYNRTREYYLIHPETDALLKKLLTMLATKGEDYTFAYMRRMVKKHHWF